MPKWVCKMGVQDGRMLWGVSEGIITQKRETIFFFWGGGRNIFAKISLPEKQEYTKSRFLAATRISFSHKLSHILDRYIASSFRDWDIWGD